MLNLFCRVYKPAWYKILLIIDNKCIIYLFVRQLSLYSYLLVILIVAIWLSTNIKMRDLLYSAAMFRILVQSFMTFQFLSVSFQMFFELPLRFFLSTFKLLLYSITEQTTQQFFIIFPDIISNRFGDILVDALLLHC